MNDDIKEISNSNSWAAWHHHVLKELERTSECLAGIKRDIADLKESTAREIAVLKVKSGVWGVIGGAVPILILLGLWVIKSK